jgi:anti-sigma B factor antagonist
MTASMPQSRSDAIDVTVHGETTKAVVSGDFDMQATFRIEPALEGALDRPGLSALEVDLSRLRFVDSTGIGVLLRVEAEARQRGVALTILPAPAEVQRIFELSGVVDALPFAG